MGWMLRRCLRCRPCWRMSSESDPLGGAWPVVWVAPPCCCVGLLFWSVVCCGGEVE